MSDDANAGGKQWWVRVVNVSQLVAVATAAACALHEHWWAFLRALDDSETGRTLTESVKFLAHP